MNQGIFPESSAKEERNEKYEREIKETEYRLSSSIILSHRKSIKRTERMEGRCKGHAGRMFTIHALYVQNITGGCFLTKWKIDTIKGKQWNKKH